jgi:hypothetical protein
MQFVMPNGPIDSGGCFGFVPQRKIAAVFFKRLLLFSLLGCFGGHTNFVADRLAPHIICC